MVHEDAAHDLGGNPGYTVFGRVVEGMDVVEKIGTTATNDRDRPLTDVTIQSIKIERR